MSSLEQQIKLVEQNSKYSRDYLNWSIGYIDLSYQFNTPEYYNSDLETHLLKTYAEGGNFESKSKIGFLVKFKKSIVSVHGKIIFKLAESLSKDRICEEWCKHEKIKQVGKYTAEIVVILSGIVILSSVGDINFAIKASPFVAGLFLKMNSRLDVYCNCRESDFENKEKIDKKIVNRVLNALRSTDKKTHDEIVELVKQEKIKSYKNKIPEKDTMKKKKSSKPSK